MFYLSTELNLEIHVKSTTSMFNFTKHVLDDNNSITCITETYLVILNGRKIFILLVLEKLHIHNEIK